jgi:ribosome maturation factor RimP
LKGKLFSGKKLTEIRPMIDKTKVTAIIEEFLMDSSIFLVDLKITGRNQIIVFIDGDKGVPISSCIELSRHLESQLDRDVEDYELEVSSSGVDKPLLLPRQFIKNTGREIVYTNAEGKKVKARLLSANDESVTIEKELSKKKKKTNTPQEEPVQTLPYSALKDVKVQVSFKNLDNVENLPDEQDQTQ